MRYGRVCQSCIKPGRRANIWGPLPDATRPSRPSKLFRPHTRFVDAQPISGLDTSSNPMRLHVLQRNSVLPLARAQDLPTLLHMHQQSRVLLLRCRVKVNMSSMRSLSGCEASPHSKGSKRPLRFEIACHRCCPQLQLHASLTPSPLLVAHASRLQASITKLIRGSSTSTISASSTDLIRAKPILMQSDCSLPE